MTLSTEYNKHLENNKFDRAKGDLKETWRLINEVINTESKQSSLPSSFKSNGIVITDPFEIANGFCRYFTNIGHRYLIYTGWYIPHCGQAKIELSRIAGAGRSHRVDTEHDNLCILYCGNGQS